MEAAFVALTVFMEAERKHKSIHLRFVVVVLFFLTSYVSLKYEKRPDFFFFTVT